ncbi:MAG TPA: sigma-70 family RNA polymerase sigma factor [Xanthomonadales bacterium]|nr:sigma-70 family RNA polymerase sigma factor [Xanthomonadales bacterium]
MAHWTVLVQGIVNGDRAAEAALITRMLPAIRVMIRRRGIRAWSDVDDLAQDAVADLLVALREGRLREQEKVAAFVAGLVRNICSDQYQRQQRLVPLETEPASGDPMDLPPERAAHEQKWSQVMRAIGALTMPRDRDILIAFYFRGEEKAEICSHFRLDPAQFDRVIHRARTRVRSLLLADIDG